MTLATLETVTSRAARGRVCRVSSLGLIDYQGAWDLQRKLGELRARNEIPDTLLLLEHPHTYTLGRTANPANLLLSPQGLKAKGAEVFAVDRGGDVTYHGPGQLVGYPIMMVEDRKDLLRYIRNLEETVIRALDGFGIAAGRIDGLSGVWIGDKKIAAIGVKMGRVTTHGFALNVTTDLTYFTHIVPCGIRDKGVTSMLEQRSLSGSKAANRSHRAKELPDAAAHRKRFREDSENGHGVPLPISDGLTMRCVADAVTQQFGEVFGRKVVHTTVNELLPE